jgi:hypothetical protein
MYLTLGRAEPAPRTTTETPGPVSPMALARARSQDEGIRRHLSRLCANEGWALGGQRRAHHAPARPHVRARDLPAGEPEQDPVDHRVRGSERPC